MDLQLAGQVAVVIGGAQGIGRAIARGFVEEHAHVVLADRDPAVTATATQLTAEGGANVQAIMADATDYDAMQRVARFAEDQFGGYHHVVFAVGAGSGKFGFPFWNLTPADWDQVLRVNLTAAANVAHAFSPALVRARAGSFLFLSSIAGQIGSQTDPPYSAAKAGLINFAQCAAKDLAEYDVRVNTICPGMIQTALNRSVWQAWYNQQPPEERRSYDDWAGEKVRRVSPLGRWQTGEDVAALAVFLASPRARNITGQTMNVDGGQVMHS
jgi:NAD(P)-dependent dehydrogenase (short-subunit alcohol dehydrogenase family)